MIFKACLLRQLSVKQMLILGSAVKLGINNTGIQQSSEPNETLQIAEVYEKEIIYNNCVFMFAQATVGSHKFHRTLVNFFGQLPK